MPINYTDIADVDAIQAIKLERKMEALNIKYAELQSAMQAEQDAIKTTYQAKFNELKDEVAAVKAAIRDIKGAVTVS